MNLRVGHFSRFPVVGLFSSQTSQHGQYGGGCEPIQHENHRHGWRLAPKRRRNWPCNTGEASRTTLTWQRRRLHNNVNGALFYEASDKIRKQPDKPPLPLPALPPRRRRRQIRYGGVSTLQYLSPCHRGAPAWQRIGRPSEAPP